MSDCEQLCVQEMALVGDVMKVNVDNVDVDFNLKEMK